MICEILDFQFMAMPTEEKRVVKKVVVQPDWTKKIIKKIIKKVPKTDWVSATNPVVEETPVSNWENTQASSVSLEDVSNLFGAQDNNQTTTQNENQWAWEAIDLWNFDFNPGTQEIPQEVPQDAPVQQDNAAPQENSWAATLDMDSLMWDTPANENSPVESVVPENQATTENPASLNLDQMISQPQQPVEQPQQTEVTANAENNENNDENFDPFMAMKTTLEWSDMAPATLDLDAITDQPAAQQEQPSAPVESVNQPEVQSVAQPEVQPVVQQVEPTVESDVPTLDLNAIPSQAPVNSTTAAPTQAAPVNAAPANGNPLASNPLTANIMKNLWGIVADPKKKKILTIAASCFWVLVLFALVFIRYPDMFAWGSQEHGSPTTLNPGITTTVTPEPDVSGTTTTVTPEPDVPGTTTTVTPEPENPTGEVIIKQKDPVSVGWEDFFTDDNITTIDLDEVSISVSTWGAVNPLGEVEWLIGPVSGNDTIVQEATEYLQKGKELKDKWAGENNRNKMRYGIFIEWKAQETLDALEKGENIDISTWISLKAQFDEYLTKGTDA